MKKFIALLLTLLLALSAAAPALAEKQTYRSLYSGEVTTLNYLTTTTTSEFGLLSNLIDTLVDVPPAPRCAVGGRAGQCRG